MAQRTLVLGSSFAGMVAALELRRHLPDEDIVVLSPSERFLYTPSLIWVPFGLRQAADISFPVGPALARRGISFRQEVALELDLARRRVVTSAAEERYDSLVIATGARFRFDAVPGAGPDGGYTESIFSLPGAVRAAAAFQRLLQEPGPVVVGALPGAAFLAPAYEFLFNLAYQLRQRGLQRAAPLTFLTPEPHLAHLGIDKYGNARVMTEAFCRQLHVRTVVGALIREVTPEAVVLRDGRTFPFRLAMLAPAAEGVDLLRPCSEITDADGFVEVQDSYQTRPYEEVFAAGAAVSLRGPRGARLPGTIHVSEGMARLVAHNIAAQRRGTPLLRRAAEDLPMEHILDAGNTGLILETAHYLRGGEPVRTSVGPGGHYMKLALERAKLRARRNGHA